MERQPTDWEEKNANNVMDKGLISNVYKQLAESSISENKQSI